MLPIESYLRHVQPEWSPAKGSTPFRLQGHCPIHTDQTPSFYIYKNDNHFHCFGCHETGDLYWLINLMEFGGVKDNAIWTRVYARAEELGDTPIRSQQHPIPLVPIVRPFVSGVEQEMLVLMRRYWYLQLWHHPCASPARRYLQKRGLDLSIVRSYFPSIGFAPYDPQGVKEYLHTEMGDMWETVAQSIGILNSNGKQRVQNRIMFTCDDEQGHPRFYQGRDITGKALAKSLNMPEFRKVPYRLMTLPPGGTGQFPGTFTVEAPFGTALLGQYGLPAIAGLGETDWLLDFLLSCGYSAPIYLAQDNDVPRPNRSGELTCPGEQQAQKLAHACDARGIAWKRCLPPRTYKDVDAWLAASGSVDVLARALEACA